MKVAKNVNTYPQYTFDDILTYYYLVPDNHVFLSTENDVTTINNLWIFHQASRIDYLLFRESLKNNVSPNYDNLPLEEKKELIRHFCQPTDISQSEIDYYFTQDEQKAFWNLLALNSRNARFARWQATRRKVSFGMTQLESLLFYSDVKVFESDYININSPEFYYWLNSTADAIYGFDYTSNGFASKSYYSLSRKNLITDIMVNGIYET